MKKAQVILSKDWLLQKIVKKKLNLKFCLQERKSRIALNF